MISKPKYISRSIWVIDISSVLFVKLYKNKIRNELAIMIAKLNLFKGFLISINPVSSKTQYNAKKPVPAFPYPE